MWDIATGRAREADGGIGIEIRRVADGGIIKTAGAEQTGVLGGIIKAAAEVCTSAALASRYSVLCRML